MIPRWISKKEDWKIMRCYRSGGCGPYEYLSCTECPASKPSYLDRNKKQEEPKEQKREKPERADS